MTFEWLFSDSHSLLRVSSLSPFYGPWSWGTSYYATHVGTMVCCYGDCQGSQSIIGVYPRQEQGYSPSIRTRFNLPHSLDHTLRSTQSRRGQRENTAHNTVKCGCDLVDTLFSIHIPGRKTLFKHSDVGLMRHCRVCFWRGQAVSRKKQTEEKRETLRDYLKIQTMVKGKEKCVKKNFLKTQIKETIMGSQEVPHGFIHRMWSKKRRELA